MAPALVGRMSADRRRSPRVPCDLPVLWKRGWRTTPLRVLDLNADGVFIATSDKIDLNFLMDLVITLPDGDLSFLGVARFLGATRHGRGVGVAIHGITPEDRKRWQVFYRTEVHKMIDAMPPAIAVHLRRPR